MRKGQIIRLEMSSRSLCKAMCGALLGLVLGAQFSVYAGIQEESLKLCEKFKQCTYKEMESLEEVTPQMKEMMDQMLETMCDNFVPEGIELTAAQKLEKEVKACFSSLQSMSCDDLVNHSDDTPECKTLERAAQDLGL